MEADDPNYSLCSSLLDEDICHYLDDYEKKEKQVQSPQSLFSDESPSPKTFEKRSSVTPEFRAPRRVSDFVERVSDKTYTNVSSYIRGLKDMIDEDEKTVPCSKTDIMDTPKKANDQPKINELSIKKTEYLNDTTVHLTGVETDLDGVATKERDNPISVSQEKAPPYDMLSTNQESGFSEESCELKRWGLPAAILSRYHDLKITHMFPWQAECLSLEGVLEGRNLVYCAPTSAGKTLVAELLLIKRALETKAKIIFILPFVSVANEKTSYLQGILENTDIKVGGFFGTKAPPGGFSKIDIAVCTIEKANNIVNRLMEDQELNQLGTVVVDEIHMVGDNSRGYLLELLLTKLLYHCKHSDGDIQMIGMTATLPNLDLFGAWMDAALYSTNYRPVPLTELVKIGCMLYDVNGNCVRTLPSHDQEHIIYLCQETLRDGHNVLIFCPTKAWTEKLALLVASHIIQDKQALDATLCVETDELAAILEQLERLPLDLDATLARTLKSGVAFHHAGLTVDERNIVEAGFRRGIVRVLVATSTLSAGVNLPARRVIIRSPKFGSSYMTPLVYQQMSGRAGRKGIDGAGESILICTPADRNYIPCIVKASVDTVSSCLGGEKLGMPMKRAVLEIVVSGLVSTRHEMETYFGCTLLAAEENSISSLTGALEFLLEYEFISQSGRDGGEDGNKTFYKATKLGTGTLNSALPPDEALALLSHLQKARRNFNLESELQLIFEVTPLSISYTWPTPDWMAFIRIWDVLPASYKRAAENMGVTEGFFYKAASGMVYARNKDQKQQLQVHLRFIVSLALLDIISEVPLDAVARKYSANRGMLQTLQTAAASYAGQVTMFCRRLNFTTLSLLLSDLQHRLFSGVHKELVDLVRVSLVSGPLARALFNAGYIGVAHLSKASPDDVMSVLSGVLPFNSADDTEHRSWLDKRHGLTESEAAAKIIDEAKEILKDDLDNMNVSVDIKDIIGCKKSQNSFTTKKSSNSLYEKKDNDETRKQTVLVLPSNTPTTQKRRSICATPVINISQQPGPSHCFGETNVAICAQPRVLQLKSPTEPRLSSTFDELNVSAWDFLDVDLDLINDGKRSVPSPKRKVSKDLVRSPIKKLKSSNSPKKSPGKKNTLQFREDNTSVSKLPKMGRDLNTEFSEPKDTMVPSTFSLKVLKGPRDIGLDSNPTDCANNQNIKPSVPPKVLAVNMTCLEVPKEQDKGYSVIDTTGDFELFQTFIQEWGSKSQYAIAIAWEPSSKVDRYSKQALSFCETVNGTNLDANSNLADVVGVAVCWGDMDCYYVSLRDDGFHSDDLSVSTPELGTGLSLDMRQTQIKKILEKESTDGSSIQRIGFDMKTQWKMMAKSLDICIEEDVFDCKIAAWMLDPDQKEKHFLMLVTEHIIDVADSCGLRDPDTQIPATPRLRSCLDALLSWYLHVELEKKLKANDLLEPYREVESPCLRTLARMELNGFGFDKERCAMQRKLLQDHLEQLEKLVYKLARTEFELGSPLEVSKILFQKLHLPPTETSLKNSANSSKKKTKVKFSTGKEVLERLSFIHPLPKVILEWRKVRFAISKTFGSIDKLVVECPGLKMDRVYCQSQHHTATGRISFHEPNLHNINREFLLDFPDQIKTSNSTFVPKVANLRSMFVPFEGAVFLAADYSQLELRILAHMSGDKKLRDQLNSGGDVFKAIASQWKEIPVEIVSDVERQQAKQICYGIIYGMGAKSLSEALKVSEDEAERFIDSFKSKYSALKSYIRNTIKFCTEHGYVQTILKRKRYFPHITSENSFAKAQAERQCVNTTIQGSAADLVKCAMRNIDASLLEVYKDAAVSHSHRSKLRTPKGGFLVLHLHDELIFEVSKSQLDKVARIVKQEMETAIRLRVVLPVKLKVGSSWGDLTEFTLS